MAYTSLRSFMLQTVLSVDPDTTRHPKRCSEEEFNKFYDIFMEQARIHKPYERCTSNWKLWRGEFFTWRSYFERHILFPGIEPPRYDSTSRSTAQKPVATAAAATKEGPLGPSSLGHGPQGKLTEVNPLSHTSATGGSKTEQQTAVDSDDWRHVLGGKKGRAAVARIVDAAVKEKNDEIKRLRQELEKLKLAQGPQVGESSTSTGKGVGGKTGGPK